jgi:hypothetical protein
MPVYQNPAVSLQDDRNIPQTTAASTRVNGLRISAVSVPGNVTPAGYPTRSQRGEHVGAAYRAEAFPEVCPFHFATERLPEVADAQVNVYRGDSYPLCTGGAETRQR